jgi:phosphate starvation-inducible PhoH-like protein
MKEKVDPYLRRSTTRSTTACRRTGRTPHRLGEIEIAPIAFMRGRTLADAFVILDEAQNTTPAQMKMFLTRFGQNSRMVICGDPRQVDLPGGTAASGLADAVRLEGWKDRHGPLQPRRRRAPSHRRPIVEAYEGKETQPILPREEGIGPE